MTREHVFPYRPHDHVLENGTVDVRGLLQVAALDAHARQDDEARAEGAVVKVALLSDFEGLVEVSVGWFTARYFGTVDVDERCVRVARDAWRAA